MSLQFDITGDPLSLPNIRACLSASRLAYDAPTYTDPASGESVFIQDCGNAIVVAFPGTHDLKDIVRDLECDRRGVLIAGHPCSVHKGFDDSYQALAKVVSERCLEYDQLKPLFFAGHSKGAALAKRFAIELYLPGVRWHMDAVITFGEPRGGDARYHALYNSFLGARSLRITNGADPVPWVPAWLAFLKFGGYRHAGIEGFMPPGENQIVYGPKLWWKVAKNFPQIMTFWRNWAALRGIALGCALQDVAEAIQDHHIASYEARIARLS